VKLGSADPIHDERVGPTAVWVRPARVEFSQPRIDSMSFGPFPSVQVNVDHLGRNILGDAANEPSIAVDPTDPSRMAIGWRQFDAVESPFRQAGYGYTRDGGKTWTFPGSLTPGVFGSDPVLRSDPDGVLYYLSINDEEMRLFKSYNGGAKWEYLRVAPEIRDKPWMAVDRTDGPGRGFGYIGWGRALIRSTDGGKSFGPEWGGVLSQALDVGADGTLYVAAGTSAWRSAGAPDRNRQPMLSPRSTPSDAPRAAFRRDPNRPIGSYGQSWIAPSRPEGPFRGYAYMLAHVLAREDANDPMDLMVWRRLEGNDWSPGVLVNDDPPGEQAWQWFGTLTLAPNARLDAVWYDTREKQVSNLSQLFHSSSVDGGRTWSRNVAVSPVFDSQIGHPYGSGKLGDYIDAVSDDAGVNVAYAATFNGEQDVYFVRIDEFDCNGNQVPDGTDIAIGRSEDCTGNGIPDECEADCNGNRIADSCDVARGVSADCGHNGVPDECEKDCNGNLIADSCELAAGQDADCDWNGTLDSCDIAEGRSDDCNRNAVPDRCDIAFQRSPDCNDNDVPDECEIRAGTSFDLNKNNVPDECENLGIDLLVVRVHEPSIDRFDGQLGGRPFRFDQPPGLDPNDFRSIALDPDGNVLVASDRGILRYEGRTGAFIEVFIPDAPLDVHSLLFRGGLLYAAEDDEIRRFDGRSGQFIDVFVKRGGDTRIIDFAFGTDGDIYALIRYYNGPWMVRFDGLTGRLMREFHLDSAASIEPGLDGRLYVSVSGSRPGILRYSVHSEWLRVFSEGVDPGYLRFGPDGNLYVGHGSVIDRIDGLTGEYIDSPFVAIADVRSELVFVRGDGVVECGDIHRVRARCRTFDGVPGIEARIQSSLPRRAPVYLTLNGVDRRRAQIDNHGRARVFWHGPAARRHRVCVDDCWLRCDVTRCRP